MWGILYGCLGAVCVIGGFTGLMLWLTWPQDSFDFVGELDELEDEDWKSH